MPEPTDIYIEEAIELLIVQFVYYSSYLWPIT